ncbi:MAG: OmpA family protein [Spirochaetaceae bacterium]
MKRIPLGAALLLLLLPAIASPAQEALLTLDLGSDVEILRRWNYTVRLDGRYQGHTNRETLLLLSRPEASALSAGTVTDGAYAGELMVSENTQRDSRTVAQRMAERKAASVSFSRTGGTTAPEGQRAPLFRSVPRFPEEPVAPGEEWLAPGVAQLYIEGDRAVAVPVLVAYRYDGVTDYQGARVHQVSGKYALRAPLSRGELGSHPAADLIAGLPTLPREYVLHGTHDMTVLLPLGGGPPILQRTMLKEQLRLPSGSIEERSGFLLTWYRSTGDFDVQDEAGQIAERIERSGIKDVEVTATEDNRVSLSLRNLQFVADQAILLPGERPRLDEVAEALRSVPDRNILIVGHTADVGTQISQIELSFERAKKIVDEMVARGIEAGRLLYDGRGGTEPVASNDTEEGRAANRRVEIEILPSNR